MFVFVFVIAFVFVHRGKKNLCAVNLCSFFLSVAKKSKTCLICSAFVAMLCRHCLTVDNIQHMAIFGSAFVFAFEFAFAFTI